MGEPLTAAQLAELSKMSKQTMNHAMVPTDQLAKLVAGYSPTPAMPRDVAELVEAAENCDQREWTAAEGQRLYDAIAAVKALYRPA